MGSGGIDMDEETKKEIEGLKKRVDDTEQVAKEILRLLLMKSNVFNQVAEDISNTKSCELRPCEKIWTHEDICRTAADLAYNEHQKAMIEGEKD